MQRIPVSVGELFVGQVSAGDDPERLSDALRLLSFQSIYQNQQILMRLKTASVFFRRLARAPVQIILGNSPRTRIVRCPDSAGGLDFKGLIFGEMRFSVGAQNTLCETWVKMKPRNIFKDTFGLAVRLLGLYFLYTGLKDLDVQTLMDLPTLKNDSLEDIITAILPVMFNLAVAWWLLGSKMLIRRAYAESPRISEQFHSQPERVAPVSKPDQPQGLTDMETAEKKLAALVGKST